jgi:signal peptidase I
MNTPPTINTQRRPWLAILLSSFLPGLGQLYCGATLKCLCFSGLMSALGILSLLAVASPFSFSHRSPFQTDGTWLTLSLALATLVYVYSVVDARSTALKTRDDYRLKDYNRWYAYVLFCIAVSGGYLFAGLYVRETRLEAFNVPSDSMYPAIWPGDRLLAAKNVYLAADPAIGDIVIFRNPDNRTQFFIKRVVALEGDTVEIRNNELYINGTKLPREEAPAPAQTIPQIEGKPTSFFYEWNHNAKYEICISASGDLTRDFPRTVVPKNQCFVLGDNRDNSLDSRVFGPIPIVGIIGKASFIYAPSHDWSRFGRMD